jgi:MFS family permease
VQALVSVIAAIASGEASEAVAKARRTAMLYAAAGLFLLFGVVFLLIAGFIVAAQRIGPVQASLWFGGGFILLALILLAVKRIGGRARARRETKRRREEARAVAGAAAIALLPSLLASRVGGLALVLPAAAALAYGVWRENAPRRDSRD